MGITLQPFECGHIYFLLIFIISFITTIYMRKFYNTLGISKNLFHVYILTISDLSSVIFYFITKFRSKKSKNDEIENLSPASKKDIQLITLSGEPISKFKLLKRTFIVALTDLLSNLSIFFYYLYIEITGKLRITTKFYCFFIFNIISKYLFSRIMLNIYFYRHHYLSFGINIFCLLFLSIIDIISIKEEDKNDTLNLLIFLFVNLFRNVIFSFQDVIGKKALDEEFLSPYSLIFYKGIFKAIMLIIISIPFFFISINGHFVIKEIRDIFIGPIDILRYTVYIIFNLSYNIFLWIIIDKYNPNYLAVANIIDVYCPLLYTLFFDTGSINWNFYVEFSTNIILVFGALIHNEIILISYCGLDEYTKFKYNQKSQEDLRLCTLSLSEQNFDSFNDNNNNDNRVTNRNSSISNI